MKKGISLIVLVITIIVMIILAAAVVITLNNSGVINRASQAVDLTNESQVQDLAALVWSEAYLNGLRGQDLIDEVTITLGEQGIKDADWNIDITDSGITVNKSDVNTLGALIKGAEDYGKTVDYTVKVKEPVYDYEEGSSALVVVGYNDKIYSNWQILHEDEDSGYVFLILNGGTYVPFVEKTEATDEINNLYRIFKLGNDEYTLTNKYENNKIVAGLISNYSSFANTTETYKDYVIGAIGGPTIELLAASYNLKHKSTLIEPIVDLSCKDEEYYDYYGYYTYNGEYGYFINEKRQTPQYNLINDQLYTTNGNAYMITTPASNDSNYILIVNSNGIKTSETDIPDGYNRPVICLRASIPATVGTTTDFSLVK